MKTSNKLLLAIFCTIILLTTAVQMVVLAKYKRGEYVKFNRDALSDFSHHDLPAVRFISVIGLGNFSIIPVGKPRLEIQNEKDSHIKYRVVNDTLFINGDSSISQFDLEPRSRNYNRVNIYLPYIAQINAAHSELYIGGAADSATAPSYNIHLEKSSRLGIISRDTSDLYFNQLHIEGDGSRIELHERSIVNNLNAQLVNTLIEDRQARIKSITMRVDATSTVTLSGKNIKALK